MNRRVRSTEKRCSRLVRFKFGNRERCAGRNCWICIVASHPFRNGCGKSGAPASCPWALGASSSPHLNEPAVEWINLLPHHSHPPGIWMQRIQQYVERIRHNCRRHFEERRFPALQPAVPRAPGHCKIGRPTFWQGTDIDAPYLHVIGCLRLEQGVASGQPRRIQFQIYQHFHQRPRRTGGEINNRAALCVPARRRQQAAAPVQPLVIADSPKEHLVS
jgi:hypothetical protein